MIDEYELCINIDSIIVICFINYLPFTKRLKSMPTALFVTTRDNAKKINIDLNIVIIYILKKVIVFILIYSRYTKE